MSGDTEDMTVDGKSVDSALIWTDNPELEYFRSMLDDKQALGSDVDDSLIGDSTVREMLEITDGDSSSRNNGSPLRRFNGRDTSGLSDTESNTVDNIYIGDESILDMKKTLNMVYDDGTIETRENEDLLPPITGNKDGQNLNQHQTQEQEQNITPPDPNPNDRPESPKMNPPDRQPETKSPPKMKIFNDAQAFVNEEVQDAASISIPGFIFVTDGHPSIIRTSSPDPQSDKASKYNDKGEHKRKIKVCLPRNLIICMTLVVIIACTVVGVLVYRTKSGASELTLSQRQDDGSPFFNPSVPPTSEPTHLRGQNRPQIITEVPTSNPTTDEFSFVVDTDASKVPAPSSVSSPTVQPTIPSTMSPSPPPTASTSSPTVSPSPKPTASTSSPTVSPSPKPTASTSSPTIKPTATPTSTATIRPTNKPPAPTAMPTDVPEVPQNFLTSSPTASTSVSSTCVATIATDKTCYRSGEAIKISFNNCEPTPTDWIGIYPSRQGMSNLRQPTTWIWTCGDQLCNNAVTSGEATLYNVSGFGSFRALLLRENGYTSYAFGNYFTISSRCN